MESKENIKSSELLDKFADIGDFVQQDGGCKRKVIVVEHDHCTRYIGLQSVNRHTDVIPLEIWNKGLFSKVANG